MNIDTNKPGLANRIRPEIITKHLLPYLNGREVCCLMASSKTDYKAINKGPVPECHRLRAGDLEHAYFNGNRNNAREQGQLYRKLCRLQNSALYDRELLEDKKSEAWERMTWEAELIERTELTMWTGVQTAIGTLLYIRKAHWLSSGNWLAVLAHIALSYAVHLGVFIGTGSAFLAATQWRVDCIHAVRCAATLTLILTILRGL